MLSHHVTVTATVVTTRYNGSTASTKPAHPPRLWRQWFCMMQGSRCRIQVYFKGISLPAALPSHSFDPADVLRGMHTAILRLQSSGLLLWHYLSAGMTHIGPFLCLHACCEQTTPRDYCAQNSGDQKTSGVHVKDAACLYLLALEHAADATVLKAATSNDNSARWGVTLQRLSSRLYGGVAMGQGNHGAHSFCLMLFHTCRLALHIAVSHSLALLQYFGRGRGCAA